jgi:thiamine pyrophosphate-dependent acetolactate synthase large subunit-like protein
LTNPRDVETAPADRGAGTRASRYECLSELAKVVTDELVITNVARTGFEWHALAPREGNLYTMAMGLVTPVAFGLALSLPGRRVIALDGDGSLLLNLGALATIANHPCPNLISIVFDNESYASTGGLPTATAGPTDLAAIARGAGIQAVETVTSAEAFRAAAERALGADGPPGPWVIVAKVSGSSPRVSPKLMDGRENKFRFVRHIEATEGVTILKPSVVGRSEGGQNATR